jgi:hypothetical protein
MSSSIGWTAVFQPQLKTHAGEENRNRWNQTAGFIRCVSEIEDENENDDENDI